MPSVEVLNSFENADFRECKPHSAQLILIFKKIIEIECVYKRKNRDKYFEAKKLINKQRNYLQNF